jgi:predicted GNAT family acetyltransferase
VTELSALAQENEAELRAFLMRDPFYNLFMIGDLEMFGLGADGLAYWGAYSTNGKLVAVAMRYRENWCFYGCADLDPRTFAQLIDDHPCNRAVNGHPEQVDPIIAWLQRYGVGEQHASFYCRMPLDTVLAAPSWPTRRATLADVDALTELYAAAGIMRRGAADIRHHLGSGRRYVVAQDGARIVSSVCTSVETSSAAMVGGVFTPEHSRNRGYATAAMTHLCSELIVEGKQPCLFYDNPGAGSIYRRLGFEDIGPWHLVLLEPKPME